MTSIISFREDKYFSPSNHQNGINALFLNFVGLSIVLYDKSRQIIVYKIDGQTMHDDVSAGFLILKKNRHSRQYKNVY